MNGFTFERRTGFGRTVPTEEETARLKAGPRWRRLFLHLELSQLCQFLTGDKKKMSVARRRDGGTDWRSEFDKWFQKLKHLPFLVYYLLLLDFVTFNNNLKNIYAQKTQVSNHQGLSKKYFKKGQDILILTGEAVGGGSFLSGGEWSLTKARPYAMF